MPSFYEDFVASAEARPFGIAIGHRHQGAYERVTYSELKARVEESVVWLEHLASPILLMYMAKSIDNVVLMLAALAIGKPFACLNRRLKPPQLENIVTSTGANCCVCDASGHTAVAQWMRGRDGGERRWRVCDDKHKCRVVIGLSQESEVKDPGTMLGSAGACLFTSGSTGIPKGVLIERNDLRERAWAEAGLYELSEGDVLLSILPFSFDVGLNQLLSAFLKSSTLIIEDSWLPADIARATRVLGITGISGVPSIWKDMLSTGARFETRAGGGSLRYITVSGGDLLKSQLESLPELAPGVGIYKTYGQTESFRTSALLPQEFDDKRESVGRHVEGVSFSVIDDNGKKCLPYEEGEIIHAGLGVMLGYLGGGAEQKLKWLGDEYSELDGPVVFTGDYGYYDDEGYLFLNGRRDEMLKIASNRVYPKDVLSVILSRDYIADSAIVGTKDETGEVIMFAFVAPKLGNTREFELKRYLARNLPSYMLPREFCFLDQLPRTESGKPDGKRLKEIAGELLRSKGVINEEET